MSPTSIRRWIRRCRRHVTLTLAFVCLAGAVAAHHSGVAPPGMRHDDAMHAAIELGLGVFTAVGAGIVAVAFGLLALGRWRPASKVAPAGAR